MAVSDIIQRNSQQTSGALTYTVAASSTLIYPGEPVTRALGGVAVTPMATNKPVIKIDRCAFTFLSQTDRILFCTHTIGLNV